MNKKLFIAPTRVTSASSNPSGKMSTSNTPGTGTSTTGTFINPPRNIMTTMSRGNTNTPKNDATDKTDKGLNSDKVSHAGKSSVARDVPATSSENQPQPSTSQAPAIKTQTHTRKNTARKSMDGPRAPITKNLKIDGDATDKTDGGPNSDKASHAGKSSVARDVPATSSETQPQPSTSQAPATKTHTSKNTARKSMGPPAPNTKNPKKPVKSLTDQEYNAIFDKALNPSPRVPESSAGVQEAAKELSIDDTDTDMDSELGIDIDGFMKMGSKASEAQSMPSTSKGGSTKTENTAYKVIGFNRDLTESDIEDLEFNPDDGFRGFPAPSSKSSESREPDIDEFMKMGSKTSEPQPMPSTSKSGSTKKENSTYKINVIPAPPLEISKQQLPRRAIAFNQTLTESDIEDLELNPDDGFRGFPASSSKPIETRENDDPSTPMVARAPKRTIDYDETPVTRNPRKKFARVKKTFNEEKENVDMFSESKSTKRTEETSFESTVYAPSDATRRSTSKSPLSDISNESRGSPTSAPEVRGPVPFDDVYPTSGGFPTASDVLNRKPTADDENQLMPPPPPASSRHKLPLSQNSSEGRQSDSHSRPSSQASNSDVSASQESTYSVASSQLDTEGRLEWLLPRRMVGTWVLCNGCKKWRYISTIHDPTVFPTNWYCNMSPDPERNSCQADEQRMKLKDEVWLIENDYAPGSVVWTKIRDYPWWPAIVDDDPDYFQFFWFDGEATQIPTQYHVVFFDKQPSRAWVKVEDLRRFSQRPYVGDVETAKGKLRAAWKEANLAIAMQQPERLRKYGVLARFRGKFNDLAEKRRATQETPSEIPANNDASSDSDTEMSQVY